MRGKSVLKSAGIPGTHRIPGTQCPQNRHHTAFDRMILGICPDYVIEVRSDILEEKDGPMLRYGLQGLNRERLILPRSRSDYPDQDRLESRFKKFKQHA